LVMRGPIAGCHSAKAGKVKELRRIRVRLERKRDRMGVWPGRRLWGR
jgi:hypothetical protein